MISRARRFYVPGLAGSTVTLSPEESHHALDVLRLDAGAEVELFDGLGRSVRGTVSAASSGSVTVELGEELGSNESPLDLTIALAVPKSDRMAFAVQKLTELGARRIVPLVTARSVAPARGEHPLDRWRRIALEAAKQSGRSRLVDVTSPRPLADVLSEDGKRHLLMAHPGASRLGALDLVGAMPLLVLIGPEGGWTEDELDMGVRHGALRFGMGPRVLRTETAAVAATVLLQSRLGDG